MSPELVALRPTVDSGLRANLGKKATTSDFTPTLLAIAGITTSRFSEEQSLASLRYQEKKRLVLTPLASILDVDKLSGSSLDQNQKQ